MQTDARIAEAIGVIAEWLTQLATRQDPAPTQAAQVALLNANQIAAALGVPKSWVREQSRLGNIPVVKLGHYCRYRLADVEAALAERDGHD